MKRNSNLGLPLVKFNVKVEGTRLNKLLFLCILQTVLLKKTMLFQGSAY